MTIRSTATTATTSCVGLGGNDHLVGGAGADEMLGGAGDDTYVVDDLGDDVFENAGDGNDRVNSFIDYTLTDNVDNLALFGSALNGTGNSLRNTIIGNLNGNVLSGGDSHDVLYGLGGGDVLDGGAGIDTRSLRLRE